MLVKPSHSTGTCAILVYISKAVTGTGFRVSISYDQQRVNKVIHGAVSKHSYTAWRRRYIV